jgi:DnaA regulatory inactivator Hda
MKQLLLPLNTVSLYTRTAWTLGDCNKDAMSWVDTWPNWQNVRFVCVFGEAGSGKTHLAHTFQNKAKAFYWDAKSLELQSPYEMIEEAKVIVLDNADLLSKDHSEWLFHFYNCVRESDIFLMMTAKKPPTQWETILPDLKSRLSTIVSVELGQPDDALLTAIFQKQLHERGMRASLETIDYLLKHIERSFGAVNAWVNKLDRYAAVHHRTITIPLIRELLYGNSL